MTTDLMNSVPSVPNVTDARLSCCRQLAGKIRYSDWVKTEQKIVVEYYLVSRPEDPVMALKGGAVVILPEFTWKTHEGTFLRSTRYVLHSAAEVRRAVQDMIVDEARMESGELEFPPNMDLVIVQRCAEVIALVVQNETLPDKVEALNACLKALGTLSECIQRGKTIPVKMLQPVRDALYVEQCQKALDQSDGELFTWLVDVVERDAP